MTDSQKIERLAEFMGWESGQNHDFEHPEYGRWVCRKCGYSIRSHSFPAFAGKECGGWNGEGNFSPLTDENDFRMVLLKVMENLKLFDTFCYRFSSENTSIRRVERYMKASLPARVDALLAAIDSLSAK